MDEFQAQVTLCGDCTVGKTQLFHQFTTGSFTPDYHTTMGVDFGVKQINRENTVLTLQFWDVSGLAQLRPLICSYFHYTNVVVLVYDVSSRGSFNSTDSWVKDVRRNNSATSLVLTGNKVDTHREVSYEEGKSKADQIGAVFVETAATSYASSQGLFEVVARLVLRFGRNKANLQYISLFGI